LGHHEGSIELADDSAADGGATDAAASTDGGDSGPTLLAESSEQIPFNGLWYLVVAGSRVFGDDWCSGSPVLSIPAAGGTPTQLAPSGGLSTCGQGLAVAGGRVFFGSVDFNDVNVALIASVPVDGGIPTPLATHLTGRPVMVADDSYVYYWLRNPATSGLFRMAWNGADAGTIPNFTDNVVNAALDAQNVYVATDNGRIVQIEKATFSSKDIAKSPNAAPPQPESLAIDAAYVYWADLATNGVYAVPIGGGPLRILAEGLGTSPRHLAIDGTSAYFATDEGTVYKLEMTSLVLHALATGQAVPGKQNVNAMVIDDAFVYWSVQTLDRTQLWRVPK
jgi:hypothetical protein